ncbi:methyltransferase domain-containing protein [Phytoactinopolyspora sp. XMNu-373]|uniref:Methyltransferase domain-containing protein n=1 Tax=Phytoactinopolyspora mesophila TaxID=2650750 RepID=A0A7K3M7B4_9ACTN|nr:methyltransferase domain-containing protein [Phytoactinopolyspora mesophila]
MDTGTAELVPDGDGSGGWTVVVNGAPSSYVDLDNPTRLEFEYVQWTGHILDVVAPEAAPIDAVHIGGAGCTLALYTAATRPGSRQLVFDVDAALVVLARQAFGLKNVNGLRLKAADGRAGLATLPDASADVVIRDAFDQTAVPPHLATVEYHREVARVLRPDGIYVANVADNVQVRDSRVEAAAAQTVFTDVAMVAEPAQLRGRRYGNVLILASLTPLPEDALVRRLAGGAVRARYVGGERVRELTSGHHPHHDPT